ncbi:MAG: Do family serine endopeptidase [Spirochaetota bacterium]
MMKENNRALKFFLILVVFLVGFTTIVTCDSNTGDNKSSDSEELKQVLNNSKSKTEGNQETSQDTKSTIDMETSGGRLSPDNTVLNFQNSLRSIAESRIPAVVNIRSEVKVQRQQGGNYYDFFRKFFDDEWDQQPKQPQTQQIFGSGFIISKDGYIVTNHHVVAEAVNVTVALSDNREFEAEVIGSDEKTDTALLKVNSDNDLPTIPLGNSNDIKVGDIAIAIGNPFGLDGTFTMGVISATGRDSFIDRQASFRNYIQTDAPINQGNSGGPLLNIYGEVIGMNTAIFSTSGGGSIGIGFSVPINIVRDIVEDISDDGKVERPMLGVTVRSLNKEEAEFYGIDKNRGAIVNDIVPAGPADSAGIEPMDVITEIDGKDVENSTDVVKTIVNYDVGDVVKIKLLRLENQTETKEVTVKVELGLRDEARFENIQNQNDTPSDVESGEEVEWLGMKLGNLSDYRSQLKAPGVESGIVVLDVDRSSQAYEKGIRRGVIITYINGKNIQGVNDIEELKDSDSYLLRIYVEGVSGIIVLKK